MNNPMSATIPMNAEHVEAVQSDVNTQRAAAKINMTPTEQARLTLIEECADKLEAAGVPFQLWAASGDPEGDSGERKAWWNFHKLGVADKVNDYPTFRKQVVDAEITLISRLLDFQTSILPVTIVTYHLGSNHPVSIHSRGEHQYVPPPAPDLPTS